MIHKHIEGTEVKARFTEENGLRYRHWLEITLKEAPVSWKTACVVMQNPSYANAERADKSVQCMEKVVLQKDLPEFKGVRRLIVVNQFALIQTHAFKGKPHEIGAKNNSAIKAALKMSDIIIVGWGRGNPFEERKAFVLALLAKTKGKKIFQTRSHPSRARYEGFIQPFVPEDHYRKKKE